MLGLAVHCLSHEGRVTRNDPTFCSCHDPVPIENCLPCLWRGLREVTKARDALALIARTLADGDFPPSAVECRGQIERLSKAGPL